MGMRPETTSLIPAKDTYHWKDEQWIQHRRQWQWLHEPMSIYEVHAGSWRRHDDGSFLSYTELAEQLVPYVSWLGYTHIELLPNTRWINPGVTRSAVILHRLHAMAVPMN